MSAQLKYRTCNLCEALCGLEIEVKGIQVMSIRGDKKDPFSKGHICPKAVALKDIHEDPDRLKRPVIKRNGQWTEIEWKEAIDLVAKRLTNIQEHHGPDAVGIYQGNPSVHNLGTALFARYFVKSLKTKNRFSATSVDQLGHHLAGEMMFGHMNLMPVPDIDRTDYWLILGGNPLVSNGSIMTAPNVAGRMKKIKQRGGKVVVIDPRYTETAKKADKHLPIHPGSDIYLVLALIKRAFEKDAITLGHLEPLIDKMHIQQVKDVVRDLSYSLVERHTGIRSEAFLEVADEFLQSEKAVCYGRLGVSAAINGGLNHWAINFLNIITGNFDKPGGAMLPDPVVPVASRKSKSKRFGRWHSRVRHLPETGGELPAAAMAEEILTPGPGQIKAMVTSCGNPVLTTPNGRKLDQAFEQLEFMVSVDIYINETSRHADLILPPATGLETAHYGLAFHNLGVRNTAKYSPAVLSKDAGARYDWEIYQDLTRAVQKCRGESTSTSNITPEFMLAQGLRSGESELTFDALLKEKHGIDIGPLKTNIGRRILNDSGKINLFPEIYRENLVQVIQSAPMDNGFLLIGRRNLRSNNSWMHNSIRMVKGPNRCTLLIHPKDASDQGITDGDEILVNSKVGQVKIEVELTVDIKRGVVSIPHGWGHNRTGNRLSVARQYPGVSMNDLVDDQEVDPLTGVAIINAIPVRLQKAEA